MLPFHENKQIFKIFNTLFGWSPIDSTDAQNINKLSVETLFITMYSYG